MGVCKLKKIYTWLSNLKKFEKDPSKKYIRKFRIYPSFMYHRLDKWLSKMSLLGWHLVDSNLISFLFEQGPPRKSVYFTYVVSSGRKDSGKYDITLRHPFIDKTYGVKNKYSKLNSNKSKSYLTLEIDTEKIDIENDESYSELISDRNSLNKKLAIRNFILFGISILLIVAVTILNR